MGLAILLGGNNGPAMLFDMNNGHAMLTDIKINPDSADRSK